MTPNAADDALLLVIDIQERLAPQVADQAALVDRTGALLEAARLFGIPSLQPSTAPTASARRWGRCVAASTTARSS